VIRVDPFLLVKIAFMMTYIYRVQLIESTSDSVYESLSNLSLTLDTVIQLGLVTDS
jgi:hypothetical protein